jgi:hypothetical protein
MESSDPPPGGGFLILNAAQINCWELICAIKSTYPCTKLIAAKKLPSRTDDHGLRR